MSKEKTGDPQSTPKDDGDKGKQKKENLELTPEQLIEALKEAGLEESYKKHLQSETDKRVTQAIMTHDLKLKKEAEEAATKTKTEEEKKKEQANMSEEEKKISDLNERINKLTESLERKTGY